MMARRYRKAKQNHALKPSYVCPLVGQSLFIAWISAYRGNTESEGGLQLPSNSTSVKSASGDVVRAQRLEDNTGNLKLVSGEPFLRQQKRSSDEVNSEIALSTVRKNDVGKETSKPVCSVRAYSFVSGMIKPSWIVVCMCHQTTRGHSP